MPSGKGFRTDAKGVFAIIGKINELKAGTTAMSLREFMAYLKEQGVRTTDYAVRRYAKAAGYVFRVGRGGTGNGGPKHGGGWIDRSRVVAIELVALLKKIGEPVGDNLLCIAEGYQIDDPAAPRYAGRQAKVATVEPSETT